MILGAMYGFSDCPPHWPSNVRRCLFTQSPEAYKTCYSRPLEQHQPTVFSSSVFSVMFRTAALTAFVYLATVAAQQAGTQTAETHPALTWSQCTSSGCTEVQGSVTLDANWRWVHDVGGYTVITFAHGSKCDY